MKNPYLIPLAALTLLLTPGCDRKSSESAKHLEELQRKATEAEARQKDLERQLEEQRIATERDAIERDRQQIENDRADLERQQGEADAAKAEEIRKREEALAKREGKLEQVSADLEEKGSDLSNQGAKLDERERDLAGREALPFQDEGQTEPVGDYGNFYDSLSPYGSWFETADYGYVWQPVVVSDSNWRPYCRGRWVCTDRGWTWVSDEPFGWATYHYGRWALVRGRGWVWVPGTEWAPCWVSWRENGSHIGWAPLPPETMAYRNHRWDSSVDVQFGISAGWFNFVEYRYFGGPLYQHCLPVSQNSGWYGSTTNITYIHFQNNQVICGGPRYRDACDRFGRPIPFCRLQIDRHPRPGGNIIGIRPQIKGDRLLVSAPNLDATWNGSLKPGRIKGRMDTMVVERNEPLRPEIADRFKKSREKNVRIADRSVQAMGGADNFRQRRIEQLDENRKQVVENRTPDKKRDGVKTADAPQPADLRPQVPERVNRPAAGTAVQNNDDASVGNRPGTLDQNNPRRPGIGTPGSSPREGLRPQQRPAAQNPAADEQTEDAPQREPKEQVRRPVDQQRVDPQEDMSQRQRQADKMREDQQKQAADQQQQRETARQRQEQARQQQQEQLRQQQEQARVEQQRQRQAEQARQAQEQQREQVRQRQQAQEDARQQQQEQARQEQAQQQREMERSRQQQEENQRQQQQEQSRQRQQEENQRQQEQARQRQQDENQRQRQQQEKDQKDQDEQRKRNR